MSPVPRPLRTPIPKPWQTMLSGPCALWPRNMSDISTYSLGRNTNLKDDIWRLVLENVVTNITYDDPNDIGYLKCIEGRELFLAALRKFGGASEEWVEELRYVVKEVTKLYVRNLAMAYQEALEAKQAEREAMSCDEKAQMDDTYVKQLKRLEDVTKSMEKKRAEAEDMDIVDDFHGPFVIATTPDGVHIALPTDVFR